MIEAAFRPEDRAAPSARGRVSAGSPPPSGRCSAAGSSTSRAGGAIFLINVPIGAAVCLALRHVPESRDAARAALDVGGAALATLRSGRHDRGPDRGAGGTSPALVVAAARRDRARRRLRAGRAPPHPPDAAARAVPVAPLLAARTRCTFVVWGPISAIFLFLVLYLQVSLGYSPLQSGAALLPITVVMLALSARVGALAQRIGAAAALTLGPLLFGAGVLAIRRDRSGRRLLDRGSAAAAAVRVRPRVDGRAGDGGRPAGRRDALRRRSRAASTTRSRARRSCSRSPCCRRSPGCRATRTPTRSRSPAPSARRWPSAPAWPRSAP